jgi:SNF2 family DNA or RNA helicase
MQMFNQALTLFPFLFFRFVKQGKTIQTIATILDNRPKLQHSRPGAKHPPSSPDLKALVKEEALWKTSLAEWNNEMEMNNVPKKIRPKNRGGARAGTLVVCPVIALSQWKSEIEKFTETDTLTVGIYHGPNRGKEMPPEMMQKYDIVLTTYQVMEQDFRKMVSPNKGKFREEVSRLPLIAVLAG